MSDSLDLKATVFLPKTDFPMRAGLPKKEPDILAGWQSRDLYRRLREASANREQFVLHDGPPYANGHIHIGTALNKILKDLIVRGQQMAGRNANYVPGWDCHGLPIEWKVEERYRAAGKDKDEVPILEFRRECREFARHWVTVQSEEFQRLGVIGDWADPYLTMTDAAEAQIVREIHKFALNGGLYRGLKPVMWSVVEKTALAEAEVEYRDYSSTTVMTGFPVRSTAQPAAEGASVVIWTTTPWTLPANQALAFGDDVDYAVYTVAAVGEGATVPVGAKLLVATDLADSVKEAAKIDAWEAGTPFKGATLAGTVCAHPLAGHGYEEDIPAVAADFVTTDQGTGIVHIAPSHGADDYEVGRALGLEMKDYVADDGVYRRHVPLFAGKCIYTQEGKPGDANGAVIKALAEAGRLVAKGKLKHTYPHSWRSKAPVIFRATPQWFISMETNDLREKALAALKETRFVPPAGYTRLSSMIAGRPDWCISRQRAWGVPIALFVHKDSGETLRDPAVFDRIAEAFEAEGSDAWFARPAADFLGADYNPDDYDQVFDIVDVWFESGSTHAFVLEKRADLKWPADLYLEGSDQHRGWFHSSLLESCGTRGRAPYDAVLTHGFTNAEDGRKMSKSLGNTVAPAEVIEKYGADILRLWVVSTDYTEDQRIGEAILKAQADAYRRVRNTLRFLLGAIADYDADTEAVAPADMPELERWVLHRLTELDTAVRRAVDDFDYHGLWTQLHGFCATDLSAFYLDVRKDSLYCDRPDSPTRRAARTAMATLFDCIAKWIAPILCFTAEEAWTHRHCAAAGSVHETLFPTLPADWADAALGEKWRQIRRLRRVVTGAIELERAEKRIGSSLEAHPTLHVSAEDARLFDGLDLAEIAIVSQASLTTDPAPADAYRLDDVADAAVTVARAAGQKCERCWKILPEVGSNPKWPTLSPRDADAVDYLLAHGMVDPAAAE